MRKIFILTLVVLLTGCGILKSETDFKGNVFIVTNGAQNVKLGLVEVRAIAESDFKRFLEGKNSALDGERIKAKQEVDRLNAEYLKIKSEYDYEMTRYSLMQGKADNATQHMRDADNIDELHKANKESTDALHDEEVQGSKVSALSSKMSSAKVSLDAAMARLSAGQSAEYYFTDLPLGLAKATTDADGNFQLKLPTNGKYAIAAHGTRLISGNKEQYYWLVWINTDRKEASPMILSNNNMMDSDASENIVKVASLYY